MPGVISAEGHRIIRAPVQRLWQLLSRIESHPRFTGIWMTAEIRERSPASPLVEFRGFFGGLPVVSVQRFVLRSPSRIEFKQVRGTFLEFSGAYAIEDADGLTELAMQVAVDPGVTFFSDASVRQVLAGHIESTLARIRALAERDLVRTHARRHQPAAGAPPDDDEAGGEDAPETEVESREIANPPDTPVVPSAAQPAVAMGKRRRRRRRIKKDQGGA